MTTSADGSRFIINIIDVRISCAEGQEYALIRVIIKLGWLITSGTNIDTATEDSTSRKIWSSTSKSYKGVVPNFECGILFLIKTACCIAKDQYSGPRPDE
jgi:hypothetical protein